jgi:hypothetical protein
MRLWLVGLKRAENSEKCHSACQWNKQKLSAVLDSAEISRVLGDLQVREFPSSWKDAAGLEGCGGAFKASI